jgi:hypothetical protein
MYKPSLELRTFDVLPFAQRSARVLDLVRVLVAIDIAYLRAFPNTPPLYVSGVVYRFQGIGPEGMVEDTWQDIPRTLELGAGTCCDLAAWRVAELLVAGVDPHASPFIKEQQGGPMTVYHVLVKRNGGQTFEDPARVLGMPG